MKINLPIAGILLGAWLLPVAGYTADTAAQSAVPPSASETPTVKAPKDRHATSQMRSEHPVDDSVITTKIKGKLLKDKQVRADNIEIKTENGAVELFGTARTKAKAAHAVALARQVKGVKSVKNSIEITPPEAVAAGEKKSEKRHTAEQRHSDQPVSDTWITTKVKAKLAENKQVKSRNIKVKTLDGVVQLSGFAGSAEESSKAAELAGGIKGVKSVTNDIQVK